MAKGELQHTLGIVADIATVNNITFDEMKARLVARGVVVDPEATDITHILDNTPPLIRYGNVLAGLTEAVVGEEPEAPRYRRIISDTVIYYDAGEQFRRMTGKSIEIPISVRLEHNALHAQAKNMRRSTPPHVTPQE